jgi:phage terminase Nu1 subunit (DNA packaging protein)
MTEPVVLNSWKEISQYMGRSVRTLQRWERFGLPIHRPSGRDKSSVYALPAELQKWLEKGKPKEAPQDEYRDRLVAITAHAKEVADSVVLLRRNAETLQNKLQESMELRNKIRQRRAARLFNQRSA